MKYFKKCLPLILVLVFLVWLRAQVNEHIVAEYHRRHATSNER